MTKTNSNNQILPRSGIPLRGTNSKQSLNSNYQNSKQFDLEERTFNFARRCRVFVKGLLRTISNIEDGKQLIRASGSQAANYIEANEALSKKDFLMRIKICRKESKESRLWLKLIKLGDGTNLIKEQKELIQEATELLKIFSAIVKKSE